jgi:urea transporter
VVTAQDWALSPLVGISQIFVVESAISGALILAGIAVYSKEAAAHTLLGSTIGVATGVAMGADPSAITAGLWGFNPALTSLAVSVFFTPSGPLKRQAPEMQLQGSSRSSLQMLHYSPPPPPTPPR